MVLVAVMGAYIYFELIPKYGWFKYECDRVKVLKQCNEFIINDKSKSCLIMSDEFFEKCGYYDQLHRYRNAAARRLSEWKIALESANRKRSRQGEDIVAPAGNQPETEKTKSSLNHDRGRW